jgi:hypothetical protein
VAPSEAQLPSAGKQATGPGGVVQSTPEQQVALGTQVPSEQTLSFAVVRFVSQPSPSGGAELQSPHPAAQPVYVQPPGPQAAPWLLPDVVSHAMPHPVQLAIVFSGWQRPVQHPLPAGQPCVASHPATHVLFEQVWPSGQFESTRHPTQTWLVVSQTVPPPPPPPASVAASVAASLAASVPASPAASPAASLAPASASATQSRFDLQPGAQAVAAQYSPVGQLSFDGRHCTHLSLVVSHQGVAPWHCEFTVHCTHDCATHSCPVGHCCVGLHPGTHEFVLQTVPAAQSLLARHATQVLLVVLHLPVGAVQSVSRRHPTQALIAVSHTVPVGQVLIASQPIAQALFTQR